MSQPTPPPEAMPILRCTPCGLLFAFWGGHLVAFRQPVGPSMCTGDKSVHSGPWERERR